MKRVSVAQMKALESQADQAGLTYAEMRSNAGLELARVVHQRYFQRPTRKILGLVGSGNNGGDTLVALKHLADWGWQTQAYLLKAREEGDELLTTYRETGGTLLSVSEDDDFHDLRKWANSTDCILDGILGTGIRLPLKGNIQGVLGVLSAMRDLAPVVAVDCPSGIDCDSGKAAVECLRADLTVCMAAVKQGLLQQPALELAGEILAVDIGLAQDLPAWAEITTDVMDAPVAAQLLPERPADSHKGTFGTCLIAAGSVNYSGAVLLAARAAYRTGVGLVRAAIPGAIYDALAGQLPEATWLMLPHTMGAINGDGAKIILDNLERVNVLLLGPGWGLQHETQLFMQNLLDFQAKAGTKTALGFRTSEDEEKQKPTTLPPMVIDADALKSLAQIEGWNEKVHPQAVLTPHPGEMAALTGLPIKQIQAQREQIALEYAQRWGHVLVLKGAVTVVASPSGDHTLIPVANSALATAGTGDVLAGMIAGLIAQGVNAYSAAKTGAWLHGRAGMLAAERLGSEAPVMAGDVVEAIPQVLKEIGS